MDVFDQIGSPSDSPAPASPDIFDQVAQPAPKDDAPAGSGGYLPQPAAHPAADLQPQGVLRALGDRSGYDKHQSAVTSGLRQSYADNPGPVVSAGKAAVGTGKDIFDGLQNTVGQTGEDFDKSRFTRGITQLVSGGSKAAVAVSAPELFELGLAADGGSIAAKTAIVKMLAHAEVGNIASDVGGKVAQKYNLSPETTDLIRTAAFFLPTAVGAMSAAAGVKSGVGTVGPNADPAMGVATPGGGAYASATGTPESINLRAKVGDTRFGVNIPRGRPAPLDPASILAAEHQANSVSTMVKAQHVEATANNIINGVPPPKPPAPPTPQGMDRGELTPQTVANVAELIKAAPPAQRAQMAMEAHSKLADWMLQTGKYVGPDGKLNIIDSPAKAQKAAQDVINSEVDRQTNAAKDQADAQQKAVEAKTPDPGEVDGLAQRAKTILEGTTPKPGQTPEAMLERQLQVDPGTAANLVNGYRADRATEGVPTVGSAKEPVVEESRETVNAQLAALSKGDINTVMLPAGSKYRPALPKGMSALEVKGSAPGAGVWIYNPKNIQSATIREAAKNGTHGDLLGHLQTKDDLKSGEATVTVQATAKDGTPIQESVVHAKPELVRAQAEALQERHPDASVAVRPTHEVLEERRDALEKAGALEPGPQTKEDVADNVPEQGDGVAAQQPATATAEPAAATPEPTPPAKGERVAFSDREGVEREGTIAHRNERAVRIKGGDGKEYTVKPAEVGEARPELKPGGIGRISTSELHIDPKRFQYKVNVGAEGVTDLLHGKKWNDDLAGIVSAWRDPKDGKTYVVNGHHRATLAKQTAAKSIAVRMLKADSPEEARAIGALQNIAEGRGTSLDAAKFLRDSGMTLEDLEAKGISMGEATAQNGVALSRLDGRLFDQVVHGKMTPGRGVAIGRETGDPATQEAIVKLLEKAEKSGRRVTDGTVEELARFASTAPSRHETVDSLFGSEDQTHSTALEKAEVSSWVKRQLSTEKRVFGAVSSEGKAKTLEATGNKINAADNAERATDAERAMEVYDKLSARRGPIDDILNRAAEELGNARPRDFDGIKQRAYDDIRAAVSEALGGKQGERAGGGEEVADRPPNRAELEAQGQAGFFSDNSIKMAPGEWKGMPSTLYHGERTGSLVLGAGEGGTWATDSKELAATFGEHVEQIPTSGLHIFDATTAEGWDRMMEVANNAAPDMHVDSPPEFEAVHWDAVRDALKESGFSGINIGEGHHDGANDVWIFSRSHRSKEGQAGFFSRRRAPAVESMALPGMGSDIEAQAESAKDLSEENQKKLVESSLRTPESIDKRAGEMERESPLFRGSGAGGNQMLFGRGPGQKGQTKAFAIVPGDGKNAPQIHVNEAAYGLLKETRTLKASGEWHGLSLDGDDAKDVAKDLLGLAEFEENVGTPERAKLMRTLAYSMREAGDAKGNVIIISHDASEATATEEQFHGFQRREGAIEGIHKALKGVPGYSQAMDAISKYRGYDELTDDNRAAEITAQIAAGLGDDFGINRDQQAAIMAKFFDRVAELNGPEALDRIPQMAAEWMYPTKAEAGNGDQGIEQAEGGGAATEGGAESAVADGGAGERDAGGLQAGEDADGQAAGDQAGDGILRSEARGGGERNEVKQTETPEFKKWFGDSKIVDADGKPLVVYHGTNQPIDAFDSIRGGAATASLSAKEAIWFTDNSEIAGNYADSAAQKVVPGIVEHEAKTARLLKQLARAEGDNDWERVDALTQELEEHELTPLQRTATGDPVAEAQGANVVPAYLRINNPLIVDVGGGGVTVDMTGIVQRAKASGHDGAIFRDIADDPRGSVIRSTHYAVFKPTQIKSAIGNSGKFDPANPSILASRAREVIAKAPVAIREYIGSEAEKVRVSRELHAGLYDLQSMNAADEVRDIQLLKSIDYSAKDAAAIYHHIENPELPLTANQEKILDEYLSPLQYDQERMYQEMTEGGVTIPNYIRRYVKGRPSTLERIMDTDAKGTTGGSGGALLKKTTGSMKHRTMMALENVATGKRQVVSIKGGRVTALSKNGAKDIGPLGSGMTTLGEQVDKQMVPFVEEVTRLRDELATAKGQKTLEGIPRGSRVSQLEEKLKDAEAARDHFLNEYPTENLADTVWRQGGDQEKGSQLHRITQATTKEIEASTNLKYHKDAVAAVILSHREMGRAYRAYRFIEEFKSDPGFKDIAQSMKDAGHIPEGWKATQLPQMRGYYFEPHVAEVLDRYAAQMAGPSNVIEKAAASVGNFLRTSIFFNPLIHIPNLVNHWYVEKGVTGMVNPMTYVRMLGKNGTLLRAANAVMHQNDDFLAALDAGGPLQSQRFETQQFAKLLLDKAKEEIEKDPNRIADLAKAMGMAPVNAVKALYEFSGKATWYANDILFLQSAYEKMAMHPGMTIQDALKETGKHIPDYRLPTRIFDSKALGTLMQNPNITMFGGYHYGALKSYGQVLQSLAGTNFVQHAKTITEEGAPVNAAGRTKNGERLHALNVMGAYAFMFLIYAGANQLLKMLTGNKNAEMRYAGSSTFFHNVYKLYNHEMNPTDFATSIVTPAVQTKALAEMAFNRDIRTGHRIYNPAAKPGIMAQQIGGRLAESVAPVAQGMQIADGRTDWKKMAWGMAGISFPLHGAEKVAANINAEHMENSADDPKKKEMGIRRSRALADARAGDRTALNKLLASPDLTPRQKGNLAKSAALPYLVTAVRNPRMTYSEALLVYKAATPQQRAMIRGELNKKLERARAKNEVSGEEYAEAKRDENESDD